MGEVNRCATADIHTVDTEDMHKGLLWVVLYTHFNIRSPYTVHLTGLFCMCCMQASTLLQVMSGFPSFQGGERHGVSERNLDLLSSCVNDILYPYYAL